MLFQLDKVLHTSVYLPVDSFFSLLNLFLSASMEDWTSKESHGCVYAFFALNVCISLGCEGELR